MMELLLAYAAQYSGFAAKSIIKIKVSGDQELQGPPPQPGERLSSAVRRASPLSSTLHMPVNTSKVGIR